MVYVGINDWIIWVWHEEEYVIIIGTGFFLVSRYSMNLMVSQRVLWIWSLCFPQYEVDELCYCWSFNDTYLSDNTFCWSVLFCCNECTQNFLTCEACFPNALLLDICCILGLMNLMERTLEFCICLWNISYSCYLVGKRLCLCCLFTRCCWLFQLVYCELIHFFLLLVYQWVFVELSLIWLVASFLVLWISMIRDLVILLHIFTVCWLLAKTGDILVNALFLVLHGFMKYRSLKKHILLYFKVCI